MHIYIYRQTSHGKPMVTLQSDACNTGWGVVYMAVNLLEGAGPTVKPSIISIISGTVCRLAYSANFL